MRLLHAGLARRGVPSVVRSIRIGAIADFRAVFLTNSTTIACPVTRIDGIEFPPDAALVALLTDCHETNPWDKV
jgi:branched-subunit amino acid aminotransferase/4-amino-4-deoxychorismate lyase